jgi:hypothetical protein
MFIILVMLVSSEEQAGEAFKQSRAVSDIGGHWTAGPLPIVVHLGTEFRHSDARPFPRGQALAAVLGRVHMTHLRRTAWRRGAVKALLVIVFRRRLLRTEHHLNSPHPSVRIHERLYGRQ